VIIRPAKIPAGGTVGVVSPGGPVKAERLDHGVAYLEKRGYRVILGRHVRDSCGYLAGRDADRAEDINRMAHSSEIDALFCSRGGYGSARLLDLLDFTAFAANPKVIVGYSDATALQLALFKRTGLISFSGPMVGVEMGLGIAEFTENHFWSVVTTSADSGKLTALDGPLQCWAPGVVEGRLLGGNLSMLCSLIGTPYLPDFSGTILIIEDIGEYPYRIDRKLMQLRLAGLLQKASGLVVGQFTDCNSDSDSEELNLKELVAGVVSDLDIPVVAGLPYGHEANKYTIPLGVRARLNATDGYLEFLETATV